MIIRMPTDAPADRELHCIASMTFICEATLGRIDDRRQELGGDRRGNGLAVRQGGEDRLEEDAVDEAGIDVVGMVLAPPCRSASRLHPLVEAGRPGR
ncbi:hypothetical protein VQ042_06540 [Aurantimonas sp. A2-1-M11]|uniref:hypothetical protein n=1 Tax=Aurantimonas sp. A2-1-M11 TaxID=3113712 RepID=UPI002F927C13